MKPERIAELRTFNSQECDGTYCPTKAGSAKIVHECLDAIEALRAERDRYRDAFDAHARHDDGCSAAVAGRYACKCGYAETRVALAKERG